MDQHVKSINTDSRSKKRFRFASSKQRSKRASADVYRSYKRRIGVTGSASREERVHFQGGGGRAGRSSSSSNKRQKTSSSSKHHHHHPTTKQTSTNEAEEDNNNNNNEGFKKEEENLAITTATKAAVVDYDDDDDIDAVAATFTEELDLSYERNPSETFRNFYREVWPLCRSLPEILHHSSTIIEILLSYLLSNASEPHVKSTKSTANTKQQRRRERFVLNHATADILHLLAVLAKDIRHEIHPYLHTQIMPRIITDLLNQPTTTTTTMMIVGDGNDNDNNSNERDTNNNNIINEKQLVPLDVSIIEAAFRTLSYIFRYDIEALVSEQQQQQQQQQPNVSTTNSKGKCNKDPCLESLRQYYGSTLAHRRDVVRRLAAETFGPVIRKLRHDNGKRRHLKRVMKALVAVVATKTTKTTRHHHHDQQQPTPRITMTASERRLQANAVDGISHLFFEVARGVSGQMHSKGGKVATRVLFELLTTTTTSSSSSSSSNDNNNNNNNSPEIIHAVTSSFLDKICHHLDRKFYGSILNEIIDTTERVLVANKKKTINKKKIPDAAAAAADDNCNDDDNDLVVDDIIGNPMIMIVRLLNQIVLFRNGIFLLKEEEEEEDQDRPTNTTTTRTDLLKCVVRVLDVMVPLSFSKEELVPASSLCDHLLSLLCSTWKAVPNDNYFAKKVRPHLDTIVQQQQQQQQSSSSIEAGTRHPAQVLAEDLIPHLPASVGMGIVGTTILSAAATIIQDSLDVGLSLLLALARSSKPDVGDDETRRQQQSPRKKEDSLFSFEGADQCQVSPKVRQTLLDACLLNFKDKKPPELSKSTLNRLGIAARCISFVALAGLKKDEEEAVDAKGRKSTLEKALKWLLLAFATCSGPLSEAENADDRVIASSLALESFARLSIEMNQQNPGSASLKKMIGKARTTAEVFLLSQSTSLWALRGCSSFVESMKLFDLTLNKRDDIYDALVPHLRSPSHFRRLYSLQILQSFPKKPFVTDYADIDYTDDLDEEPTPDFARNQEKKVGSVARSGLCDILDTLTAIESTVLEFESERQLLSLISRIEILGRTAKLPVVYTEAAANHMLGILHIKYSPIWPNAVRAFVSLANGQDTFIWSPLKERINTLMNTFPRRNIHPDMDDVPTKTSPIHDHHDLCKRWDQSNGTDVSVFGKDVSDHLPTDDATVLQHLWSVLEGAPQLLTKHNRQFVPIFLQFMHSQFYSFYPHDPDARELLIQDHIDDKNKYDRQVLESHIIQQRLISMLKVFAAVKGPKQLFKHSLLLSIYTALLSQETAIAQLAFSCIVTYKLPSLTCFSQNIEALFAKGGLREGLLKFTTALESIEYDKEQRHLLLPIVMRVLFGRLSARTGGSKSSKDSPTARRAAVLSFLAVLCESDDELYPFVYLMIRSYVPTACQLLPVQQQEEDDRNKLMKQVTTVSVDELASLPVQVHIGFLHLLDPVVGQLGHRVTEFADQFTSIILCLCKLAEIKQPSSDDPGDGTTDDNRIEDKSLETDEDHGIEARSSTKGFGSIRTLCFRRLSEIFAQFSEVVDFAVYGHPLWNGIKHSVKMLPETVVQSDKVPALLSFMLTLSSHSKLLPLLSMHDPAIPCVIRCLADTSCHAVVDATLSFIDNLLGNEDGNPCLVDEHVDLILHQFMVRLGSKSLVEEPETLSGSNNIGNKAKRSVTWRRELRILCRITEIVQGASGDKNSKEAGDSTVAENLCALLTPYLEQHGNGVTETDQMNVLQILEALIPKIGAEAADSYFQRFARLLGPSKGKPGLTSIPVRQGIASVLRKTSQVSELETSKVSSALQSLCKSHAKRVDEMDYDSVIPSLNSLVDAGSETCWISLATAKTQVKPGQISPIISTCLHYLFNEDGVVSRGSFKALKSLIGLAAQHSALDLSNQAANGTAASNEWLGLLEKNLVPAIRTGLSTRNISARRFYILLMAEVASTCKENPKPNLYGDLSVLVRDDEPDLDFFLNITHVQMHRRTRAFQRLRKVLASSESTSVSSFTLQSLSNVLLPITLHPIYESHTNAEEPFAIEAIATVGAISRHLSWSKYSATLWTSLTQFSRHAQQERYLVGMICALIDGFHFDILEGEGAAESSGGENAVWRALEKRFIPKIEGLLTKESVDRAGTKVKTLRASLILALVKLFKKFDKAIFESRLPRLLTVICDGLKSRESDSRDVARTTLAKVATDIDIAYLPDILREVTIALNDGFRLHVRMATVHSILLGLSEVYSPPETTLDDESRNLQFDQSVPALMDIIQQDLFGVAQERKEVIGAQTRYVKEAGGSKSQNSIELVASLIEFRPSRMKAASISHSSIHSLVHPLLERLKMPNVEVATIRRVKECLTRVVAGLSRNPSMSISEVLPFVYATAAPFIGVQDFTPRLSDDDNDSDYEDESSKPLLVSGGTLKQSTPEKSASSKAGSVADWRPSSLKSSKTSKHASSVRQKEAKSLRKVQDGASAPKMTGSSRHYPMVAASRINDPANIAAVVFSLRLLYSILKKKKMTASEPNLASLVDPFVPLLTTCVCSCRETDVVLLALRCLGIFLAFDLPSKGDCAPSLGTKTLDLLSSSGVGSNQNKDLPQACFKMLILLMNIDQSKVGKRVQSSQMIHKGEGVLSGSQVMPLDSDQMKVLVSFLQESIVDTDNHNSALNLIKAMMSRRFVSPEFYDLMDIILELSVRSPRASLRQQCAGIVINYLLNYPLGDERLEEHLKQIIMNVKYEYEEGRLSGISLANMVVDKVPRQVLEKYVQLFFLPLTQQMINDDSAKCREGVATCLFSLFRRVSTDVVQSLYDFANRWSRGNADVRRASLQLFGIFLDSCGDFMKRGDTVSKLVERLKDIVSNQDINDADWEALYFSLLCMEKLENSFPKVLADQPELWRINVKCLAHSHPFVKLVSSRLINQHLMSLDAASFVEKNKSTFLIQNAGSLYEVARNLCFQLNAEEDQQSDDVTAICIKSLCWILPAMKQYPHLCYADQDGGEESDKNPVGWVMKRLSGVAKPKGPKRRQAVFKAFGAFAAKCPEVVFPKYLELMLEPLHRVDVETTNDAERPHIISQQRRGPAPEAEGIPEVASLARDVLQLLEEKCDPPEVFLTAYAAVKTRAREKKENRKFELKSEAIRDPVSAAKRRQEKNEREKKRKKRRVEDRRRERGALGKGTRRYAN